MKCKRYFKTSLNQRIVIYNDNADPQMPFHGAYRAAKGKWGIIQFSSDLKTVRHLGPSLLTVVEIDESDYVLLHAEELLIEEPRFILMAIEQAHAYLEASGQVTNIV